MENFQENSACRDRTNFFEKGTEKMKIKTMDTALFQIPLAVPLSDSTHGEMPFFELITVRIKDEEGCEGLGYT